MKINWSRIRLLIAVATTTWGFMFMFNNMMEETYLSFLVTSFIRIIELESNLEELYEYRIGKRYVINSQYQ